MLDQIFEKTCTNCDEVKPCTEFPKRYVGYSRDGYRHQCKKCRRTQQLLQEKVRQDCYLAEFGEAEEKQCRGCLEIKSVSAFDRSGSERDGYGPTCKDCNRPASKAYYEHHAATIKVNVARWREENKEQADARSAQWAKDHPERVAEIKRNWKARNPDHEKTPEIRQRKNDRRRELRFEAVAILGGKCECCGLTEPIEFLCIDHVGGWGANHRRELKGKQLTAWLKKHHYPRGNETCPECGEVHQGFRVLCYDCNMSTAASPDGTCAHKESYEQTRQKKIEFGTATRRLRSMRTWRLRVREDALEAYGGRCHCCGQSDFRLLSFEHVGGWGKEHRAQLGEGANLAWWLKQHEYPKGNDICGRCGERHGEIVLACFNCNLAAGKRNDGMCPHKTELKLAA